jgi:hypothetical protein
VLDEDRAEERKMGKDKRMKGKKKRYLNEIKSNTFRIQFKVRDKFKGKLRLKSNKSLPPDVNGHY